MTDCPCDLPMLKDSLLIYVVVQIQACHLVGLRGGMAIYFAHLLALGTCSIKLYQCDNVVHLHLDDSNKLHARPDHMPHW